MSKCDICGALAVIHVTEVSGDEIPTEHVYCEAHAKEIGLSIPDGHGAEEIRILFTFIQANNRMPSATELQQLAGADKEPLREEAKTRLSVLEGLVTFLARQDRENPT